MPEEKGINQWDPPPPTMIGWAPSPALALLALVAVWLGSCEVGAALAGLAVITGLFNLGRSVRVDLRVAAEPIKGGGGIPPDPPPPTLLKAVAAKSATVSFALSGAVVALSDCCETALLPLGLSAAVGFAALAFGGSRRNQPPDRPAQTSR